MLYFFYFTRNIIGLIMVISPVTGLLFIDFNTDLFIIFLSGAVLGIPLGLWMLKSMPFRLWTNIVAAVYLFSAIKANTALSTADSWTSIAVMGLCSPALTVLLPVTIVTGWFRSSKVQVLGSVWTFSLILGILLGTVMERFTYPALSAATVMMFAGTVFFLQKPPHLVFQCTSFAAKQLPAPYCQRNNFRIFVFFCCISFTAGLTFSVTGEPSTIDFFLSEKALFVAGICTGPAAASLLARFRGIYSSCIWLLFLAEISVACSGLKSSLVIAGYVCSLSSGLCLGGLPVVIPVITHYACGPQGYNDSLCRIITSVPAGFFLSLMAGHMFSGSYAVLHICTFAMILLIFAFFTVFSAWKHRLYLLKKPGI